MWVWHLNFEPPCFATELRCYEGLHFKVNRTPAKVQQQCLKCISASPVANNTVAEKALSSFKRYGTDWKSRQSKKTKWQGSSLDNNQIFRDRENMLWKLHKIQNKTRTNLVGTLLYPQQVSSRRECWSTFVSSMKFCRLGFQFDASGWARPTSQVDHMWITCGAHVDHMWSTCGACK